MRRARKPGITLDTSALAVLADKSRKGKTTYPEFFKAIADLFQTEDRLPDAPIPILIEFFQGNPPQYKEAVEAVKWLPVTIDLAKAAGVALQGLSKGLVVDAVVVISAVKLGNTIWTSDLDDLQTIASRLDFPVKIRRIC